MRSIIYIGILLAAVSCGKNEFRPRTGDLLFETAKATSMGGAIEAATGAEGAENFTHVAIAIAGEKTDSVLEATTDGGVRIISLQQFLTEVEQIDGRPGVVVMRLRDTTGVGASVARARKFLGQPYDYSFRPNNRQMYCSELVWESYLAPDSSHRFEARPMNFRAADGTMPRFWIELYEKLGEEIPEGVPGTNPNNMANDESLETVHRYF